MGERTYNKAFNQVFAQGKLTLGVIFPIEAYDNPVPLMLNQIDRAKQVENGGFAALWSRDVPLLDPSFGDAGQTYDPWVWLGFLAANTQRIALATGSIILPLRKPVDLAKAASSADVLSQGRVVLGVASGDRPVEYSVYEEPFEKRDERFRDTLLFIRDAIHRPKNWNDQSAASSHQLHLLPKSLDGDVPLLVTGNSRQSVDWIATHSDGWLMYPRPFSQQTTVLNQWQQALSKASLDWKPFSQSLYIDLVENPEAPPTPIHLGYRLGRLALTEHLRQLQTIGVNHVAFNLRFSSRSVELVLDELIEHVLPEFPALI
ncbi:MAG: LLM class oxidoreductase [Gammaproteobacteria bacterium]|nr:LLM class oxidoreductase [Gammaproteobacteria bacterium]